MKALFSLCNVSCNGLIYSEYISSLTCAVRSNSGDAGSTAQN